MVEESTSLFLDEKGKLLIKKMSEYYSTTAVNMLSEQQSAFTENPNKAVQCLIDYCRSYPNDYLIFIACDMILNIQSNASYLSRRYARFLAGGLFYPGNGSKLTDINNPLDVLCQIIDVVVSSAI